jgi:hypothetical protein
VQRNDTAFTILSLRTAPQRTSHSGNPVLSSALLRHANRRNAPCVPKNCFARYKAWSSINTFGLFGSDPRVS